LPDFIFDFTEEELSEMKRIAGGQDLIRKVIPQWRIKGGMQPSFTGSTVEEEEEEWRLNKDNNRDIYNRSSKKRTYSQRGK
jgi:hypothetical protein